MKEIYLFVLSRYYSFCAIFASVIVQHMVTDTENAPTFIGPLSTTAKVGNFSVTCKFIFCME